MYLGIFFGGTIVRNRMIDAMRNTSWQFGTGEGAKNDFNPEQGYKIFSFPDRFSFEDGSRGVEVGIGQVVLFAARLFQRASQPRTPRELREALRSKLDNAMRELSPEQMQRVIDEASEVFRRNDLIFEAVLRGPETKQSISAGLDMMRRMVKFSAIPLIIATVAVVVSKILSRT